ncbi:MAG: hypothetical protein JXA78_14095 [Anaerolineales bacterium]|nr:hypothetical protein [Anaerolineales bacterium]
MGEPALDWRPWAGRLLIGAVLLINVQCALLFLWRPSVYAPGFELSSVVGDQIVRAIGLLFLMWNVPYAVAVLNPRKYRLSLYEAIAMQTIGLVGETLLLLGLPFCHQAIHTTLTRFIAFDGSGLLALFLAAWITRAVS